MINDIERQMRERLAELKPSVDEYARIEASLVTLTGRPSPSRMRPAGSVSTSGTGRGKGRPASRAIQALDVISREPGITIADLAARLDIGPTYLYKLLPGLERDGKVRKVGKGYEPAG